jgi:hypothetical protein
MDSVFGKDVDTLAVDHMLAFLREPHSQPAKNAALSATTTITHCLQELAKRSLSQRTVMDAGITRALYANRELSEYFKGGNCEVASPDAADVYINYLRLKCSELRRYEQEFHTEAN